LRIYASTLLLFAAGCGIGSERKSPAELKAEKLQQEKAALTGDAQQYESELEQLRAQIRALSVLPQDKRENPYELMAVRIAKISNFFDKDGNGKQEKLVVYVQPIDAEGDIVKAAGTVSVQLWNLNKPGGEALLGQWKVEPAELRKLWFDSFAIAGYRLTFDRPESVGVFSEPLTIKVTFIDYLTGESLRAQQVIAPKLD
jgi:transcription elongation GreA/GreB family factor